MTMCDRDDCDSTFEPLVGIDHWIEVTEYTLDDYATIQYCSRECLRRDIVSDD